MFNYEPNWIAGMILSVVSVINIFGFFGQIIQLIRTKNAEGFSISSWSIWGIGCLLLLIYAIFFTSDIGLVLTNLLNFTLHATICSLVIVYRLKSRKPSDKDIF